MVKSCPTPPAVDNGGMETDKLVFSLTVSAAAMSKFADGLRKAKAVIEKLAADHRRQDWWKRSEGPPDYIADANDPEWWQDGDEPPPWGCAA